MRTSSEVGTLVKQRREQLNLTRERLVEKANALMGTPSLSTATITVFESGGRDRYRVRTELALARALDWPDDALHRLGAGEPLESIETVVRDCPTGRLDDHERRIVALERLAERLGHGPGMGMIAGLLVILIERL